MDIKRLAAAAGVTGAVGIAALGLSSGTAFAAPAQHSGTSSSSGSSSHASRGLGSEESGGGSTVPRTFYPEMPHQGG